MAHDVFISHSAKDKVTADAVCAMLESNGVRCWIAPRDVLPSMEWGEAIIDAIEESRIMVLVFTANANESPQIRREIERAVNRGVAILPLRIEDVLPGKSLEYFIGNVHWLDALSPPLEAHLKSLAGTIKILLARTEQGASPTPSHEERLPASGGHRAGQEAPTGAGGRERMPSPHRSWSARSWTWAAGTVAALLMVALFVNGRFTSHPVPAASPQPITQPPQNIPGTVVPGGTAPIVPAGKPASLRDTMSTIQKELSGIGTVSFTNHGQDTTAGSNFQNAFVEQISNVVADPAQCRVSYHWKVWQNDAVKLDKDAWFLLPAVTSVVVEPMSRLFTDENAAVGHPNDVVNSTTPSVTALIVRRGSIFNGLPFTDINAANRVASDVKQAAKLCGGHLAN